MPGDHYILDDTGKPCLCDDLSTWAHWFQNSIKQRIVRQESVGDCQVSTVFLGLNHSYKPGAEPVLWETMVFGGPLEGEEDRCSGSREDALEMHAKMVARVKATPPKP